MNRKIVLVLFIAAAGLVPAFSQTGLPEPVFGDTGAGQIRPVFAGEPDLLSPASDTVAYFWNFNSGNTDESMVFLSAAVLAAAASSDAEQGIPQNIRNNRYFIESVRLTNLAQESFEYGDYDASTSYAAEALRYAQLSDEYVALHLKIKEANDSIAAARARLDWAQANGVPVSNPGEYGEAQTYYNASLDARRSQDWDGALDNAGKSINALAYVQGVPEGPGGPLPAQYTVRAWAVSKDCLWNIAGRPWAYNDPFKWRLLYSANRSRLPDPDNPDLIHPGMVLDIPSLKGEQRQGMWDPARSYSPLP